jgi:hypothetical protein
MLGASMEVTLEEMLLRLGQKDMELFKLQKANAELMAEVQRAKSAQVGPSEADLAQMMTPGRQDAPSTTR